MLTATPNEMYHELNVQIRQANLAILIAHNDPASLTKAHLVRAELFEALAALAREGGEAAEAVKTAAQVAASADFRDSQAAARKRQRIGNPAAGVLADLG